MSLHKRNINIGLILFAGIVLVGLVLLFNPTRETLTNHGKTWQRVEGFVYVEPGQGTCLALSPQCGYCPGEVIARQCFVQTDKH